MFENIMTGIICIVGAVSFTLMFRHLRKRGEDCPRYPYDCPYCCHAPECMDIICEKNRKERERAEKEKK